MEFNRTNASVVLKCYYHYIYERQNDDDSFVTLYGMAAVAQINTLLVGVLLGFVFGFKL